MDLAFVAVLAGTTAVVGMLYFVLHVRPEALLQLLSDEATSETWLEEHPATLTALRWAVGAALFLVGFLTGLATAFLSRTAG